MDKAPGERDAFKMKASSWQRMSEPTDKAVWYAEGLSFGCTHCGRCCAGPGVGYVWLTAEEIAAIAKYLGIPVEQMHQTYVRSVGGGWSLRERNDNRDCLFLSPAGPDGRVCSIYPVRPTQCRTWPFWPDNLCTPEAWAHIATRCRGVNHGEHVSLEEIQTHRDATGK